MKLKATYIEKIWIIFICCGLYLLSNNAEYALTYNLFRIVIIVVLGYYSFKKGKLVIVPEVIWRLLFVIYTAFSLLWSIEKPMVDSMKTVAFHCVVFTFFCLYLNNEERVNNVISGFAIGGMALALKVLLSVNLFRMNDRLDMTDRNVNTVGLFLVISATIFLHNYMKTNKNIYIIIMVIILFIALTTGSKKVVIDIVCILMMYSLYYYNGVKQVVLFLIGIMLIYYGYKFIIDNEFLYLVIGKRFKEMINVFYKGALFNTSDNIRFELIKQGWNIFLHNIVFGIGLCNFELLNRYRLYSHCNYIELLCNLGLIGTMLWYVVYVKEIIELWKYKRNKQVSETIWLAATITLILLVNDIAMVSYYELFSWILFAIVIAILNLNKKEKSFVSLQIKK